MLGTHYSKDSIIYTTMAALNFKRIIGNPYSRYLGQPVRVVGAWLRVTKGGLCINLANLNK